MSITNTKTILIAAIFLCTISCTLKADTFVHKQTGQSFYGYATQTQRDSQTLVKNVQDRKNQYIVLEDYEITPDHKGRKDQVAVLTIPEGINLQCETDALIKDLTQACNAGPLCIIIKIDSPGGRVDLMKQICSAILKANTQTIAYVYGDDDGGAYSAAAIIAVACDKIYMAENTAIGAATTFIKDPKTGAAMSFEQAFGEDIGEKLASISRNYFMSIAEASGKSPLLIEAMVDKDVEIIEIEENGQKRFIKNNSLDPNDITGKIFLEAGKLLTLSPTQAEYVGISQGITTSMKDLLTKCGIEEKVKLNKYVRAERTRRDFDRAKDKLDKYLNDMDFYTKDIQLSPNLTEKQYYSNLRRLRQICRNIETLAKRWPDLGLDQTNLDEYKNSIDAITR